jgi:hypothetical protein
MFYILFILRIYHLFNSFINISDILICFLENDNDDDIINDKEKEKRDQLRKERYIVKFIVSIGLIGMFKLDTEQICYLIISNILSELVEAIIYGEISFNNTDVEVDVGDKAKDNNAIESEKKKDI